MTFSEQPSLASSSAFTMAALIGFISLWIRIHPVNATQPVHIINRETPTYFLDFVQAGTALFSDGLKTQEDEPNWIALTPLQNNIATIYGLKPILLRRLNYFATRLSTVERIAFLQKWSAYFQSAHPKIGSEIVPIEEVPQKIEFLESQIYGRPLMPVSTDFNLAEIKGTKYIFAEGVEIKSAQSIKQYFMPKHMIMVSCSVPNLGELSHLRVSDDRLMWVNSCDDTPIDLQSYFRGGVNAFALANPAAAFLSLHLPSIQLSLNWGARLHQHFSIGEWQPSSMDHLLGLSASGPGKGPIPLIENFKPIRSGQNLSLVD
jgi:hypothetical protein